MEEEEKKEKRNEGGEENRFWKALIFIVGRVTRHSFTSEFTAMLFRKRDLPSRSSLTRIAARR